MTFVALTKDPSRGNRTACVFDPRNASYACETFAVSWTVMAEVQPMFVRNGTRWGITVMLKLAGAAMRLIRSSVGPISPMVVAGIEELLNGGLEFEEPGINRHLAQHPVVLPVLPGLAYTLGDVINYDGFVSFTLDFTYAP